MSRTTTRMFLGLSLILAIGVVWFSLDVETPDIPTTGATLAAALAVITAVISAWGAQRVVELEEDKRRPYPYPHLEFTTRYGLVLFTVENSGGGSAHDIEILWHESLKNSKGEDVRFSDPGNAIQIPILPPGRSISKIVDGHVEFFRMDKLHKYTGTIKFKDSLGKRYKHDFLVDADTYKDTPTHTDEALKTHFDLQKIPDHLTKIEHELKQIRSALSATKK